MIWLLKLKSMLVPALVGVLVGAGLVAGVWLSMPTCAQKALKKSVESSHEAEKKLITDQQKTRTIYRDRIKVVKEYVDRTDNYECLDAVDLGLFNGDKAKPNAD